MTEKPRANIGFACAYTPMPLIDAAGFTPYRVLPEGDAPDRAGQLLHDNICPHVKRILDRAMAADLPDLAGMVFVNSCDAMRRLADAWQQVRPADKVAFIDLPTTADDRAVRFFTAEIKWLTQVLMDWSGRPVTPEAIAASTTRYRQLGAAVEKLRQMQRSGLLPGGAVRLQELYNRASTQDVHQTLELLQQEIGTVQSAPEKPDGVPIYLFGNVMAEPAAYDLLASCGARVVSEDICTGSRLFSYDFEASEADVFAMLAQGILSRPPCARTFDPNQPGRLGSDVVKQAKACGARGVIGHTVKFCDPYLARLPVAREMLREAGIPHLLLEGDCTLRSIEQQRTRIEAFIEMLR